MDLLAERDRLYRNFDRCMACIEDIVIIAAKTENYEIGQRVEKLLNSLEPDPIRASRETENNA